MIKFHLRSPLFAEAGEGEAGGAGAASGAVTFDPVAFKAEILGDFNKTLNGFAKTLKTDFSKMLTPAQAAASTAATATGEGEGQAAATHTAQAQKSPKEIAAERENKQLIERLAALETENAANKATAMKESMDNALRQSMGGIEFFDGNAQNDVFNLIRSQIVRDDNGNVTGPAGEAVSEYVKDFVKSRPNFLKQKDVGAAGARTGNQRGASKRVWTFDDLEPTKFNSLKPEEQKELRDFVQHQSGM